MPDGPGPSVAQVIQKVQVAIDQLEALMLSDAWDAILPERQKALAEITQQMRLDVQHLRRELAGAEPFAEED